MSNTLSRIIESVTTCSLKTTHVRCKRELVPKDWEANSICPPTYTADGKDEEESGPGRGIKTKFRIPTDGRYDGESQEPSKYVSLDGSASSANRAETALLKARKRGVLRFPDTVLKLSTGERSILEIPHRVGSRYLQLSLFGELSFPKSEWGKKVFSRNLEEAALAIIGLSPASIIFGCWISNVGTQGHFRFAKCVEMEVVGRVVALTVKTASTGDTFGIKSFKVYVNADTLQVSLDPPDLKATSESLLSVVKEKGIKPAKLWHEMLTSEAMLTPIPPVLQNRGVSVNSIKDTFDLSFHQLVKFTTGDESRDVKLRTILATLAIAAHALKSSDLALRSGCTLTVPKGSSLKLQYEFLGAEGGELALDEQEAINLYNEALEWGKDVKKFYDPDFTLVLKAGPELEKVIEKSLHITSMGKKNGTKTDSE